MNKFKKVWGELNKVNLPPASNHLRTEIGSGLDASMGTASHYRDVMEGLSDAQCMHILTSQYGLKEEQALMLLSDKGMKKHVIKQFTSFIQKHHFDEEILEERKGAEHYHALAEKYPQYADLLNAMAEQEEDHKEHLEEMDATLDAEEKTKKGAWGYMHRSDGKKVRVWVPDKEDDEMLNNGTFAEVPEADKVSHKGYGEYSSVYDFEGEVVDELEKLLHITHSDAQGMVGAHSFELQQGWTKTGDAKATAKVIADKSVHKSSGGNNEWSNSGDLDDHTKYIVEVFDQDNGNFQVWISTNDNANNTFKIEDYETLREAIQNAKKWANVRKSTSISKSVTGEMVEQLRYLGWRGSIVIWSGNSVKVNQGTKGVIIKYNSGSDLYDLTPYNASKVGSELGGVFAEDLVSTINSLMSKMGQK